MPIDQNIRLTVDVVLLNISQETPQFLLIQRKDGSWALPGGFVDDNEALKVAAKRELEEETSLKIDQLFQFFTFGDDVNRDPRGHTVSVAHWTITDEPLSSATANSDAQATKWVNWNEIPPLAFDHNYILTIFLQKLQHILEYHLPEFYWIDNHFHAEKIAQLKKNIPLLVK